LRGPTSKRRKREGKGREGEDRTEERGEERRGESGNQTQKLLP